MNNSLTNLLTSKKIYEFLGIKEKQDFLTLKDLQTDIIKFQKIRNLILTIFENELSKLTLTKNIKLKFKHKELFMGNYLNLSIIDKENNYNFLFTKNDFQTDTNNKLILKQAKLIIQIIERLFLVFENSNILNNDFYKELYIYLDNYLRLIINGDGILLDFYNNLVNNDYKNEDLAFYYHNLDNILENIIVKDDLILDNYRSNLEIKKALKLYRGLK